MEKMNKDKNLNSIITTKKMKNNSNNETNKKEFIQNDNTYQVKNGMIIIKFLIIINLIQLLSSNIFFFNKLYFSKITLKVKGIGIKKIFGYDSIYYFGSSYYPNVVVINGYIQEKVNYSYFFNETDNLVELVWYEEISNCSYMFRQCYDITEIDLSNFNSSNVIRMNSMFLDCSSLTSLNLTNLDTSRVTWMHLMFNGCSSLTSLDLSSFNTLKVGSMQHMFRYCSSLTYLAISNFDTSSVSNMEYMFANCSSLTLLNLYKFDTSYVINMNGMFYNCLSLISLNLSKFNTKIVYY